ncbi:MAG TPA: hypothetical protein VJ806_09570 [Luteimonas sp.]|nr:hypothetical protein [Luteimonas sp.]
MTPHRFALIVAIVAGLLVSGGMVFGYPQQRVAAAPEQRALQAINAKRASMGLPLANAGLKPRDCSITQQCPGGGQVSCSASGDFTDCGTLKDKHGNVSGVACSRFTNTAANGGEQATVNQSKC